MNRWKKKLCMRKMILSICFNVSKKLCAIMGFSEKSKPRETWRRNVMDLKPHISKSVVRIARLPKIAKPFKDGDAKPGIYSQ